MDIKQLHNFCKVAELGSLTAAARTLKLTQAALSRQLALLEAELEVELFRRTGRGLVPTPAGQRLLEQAHLVLQQVALIPRAVRGVGDAVRGHLALGLDELTAEADAEGMEHHVSARTLELFRALTDATAVQAITDSQFNLHGVQATTGPHSPLCIINGPIRQRLEVNGGPNVFGPGWRANGTIGRAVKLIMLNLGGAKPGEIDKSTLGHPGKYTFCIGENEEESPWEPFHCVPLFAALDRAKREQVGPTPISPELPASPLPPHASPGAPARKTSSGGMSLWRRSRQHVPRPALASPPPRSTARHAQ